MKISKTEFEELCVLRYKLNVLHEMADFESIRREERYLDDVKKEDKPYHMTASLDVEEIYHVMGWEKPLKAQTIYKEAKKILSDKNV